MEEGEGDYVCLEEVIPPAIGGDDPPGATARHLAVLRCPSAGWTIAAIAPSPAFALAAAYRRARRRPIDWSRSRIFVKVSRLFRGRRRRGIPIDRFGPYRRLLIAERKLRDRWLPAVSESEPEDDHEA